MLEHQRMAFSARRRVLAEAIEPGAELLLYATRGCFGNPSRDRGRIVARAHASSGLRLDRCQIGGREFDYVQELALVGLCRRGEGVELASRVASMRSFPNVESWSAHLRKPLLRLDATDADELRGELAPLLDRVEGAIPEYQSIADRRRKRRLSA